MPLLPDPISFPPSEHTISLKLFTSFKNITLPSRPFLSSAPGSSADEASIPLSCSGKSFLLEHSSGKKLVYDLGIRKDVSTMARAYRNKMESGAIKVDFGPDVVETLGGAGIDLGSIDAVIWSHCHFDHVGNPSTFPSSTKLVVGLGTQAHARPGYPINPDASGPESDFLGREVIEIDFKEDAPLINGMRAYDYFKDGSFYLLNAPGHCPGHIFGLARTTPTTFVLLAGDAAHHPAMLRPSPTYPLPSILTPTIPQSLQNCARDVPFLSLPKKEETMHHDHAEAARTYDKLIEFDAHPDVLVVLSHDHSMDGEDSKGGGVVPWFPDPLNGWKESGVKEATRWMFLQRENPAFRW